MQTVVDEETLKEALKQAIVEVLEERHEFLCKLLTEAIQDAALVRALREQEYPEDIGRTAFFRSVGPRA